MYLRAQHVFLAIQKGVSCLKFCMRQGPFGSAAAQVLTIFDLWI